MGVDFREGPFETVIDRRGLTSRATANCGRWRHDIWRVVNTVCELGLETLTRALLIVWVSISPLHLSASTAVSHLGGRSGGRGHAYLLTVGLSSAKIPSTANEQGDPVRKFPNRIANAERRWFSDAGQASGAWAGPSEAW